MVRLAALAMLFTAATAVPIALGQAVKVKGASWEHVEKEYQVNAELLVDLGPTLESVLLRGVPLYFVLEFRLTKPRWWWFNKKLVGIEEIRKLSYNALTRQYRLSVGSMQQESGSLYDALASLGQVRGSPSVNEEVLERGTNYEASLSLRLDVSQLPKPLQLDAVTSRQWQLASSDYTWYLHISP